jgi:isoquinoline 1-oxidoreductase subunit alpha
MFTIGRRIGGPRSRYDREHCRSKNNPVVIAWIEEQMPQCGYCQAGQIMAASALLARHPQPTEADIDREMTNICRCGTYAEIRSAIHKASALMSKG